MALLEMPSALPLLAANWRKRQGAVAPLQEHASGGTVSRMLSCRHLHQWCKQPTTVANAWQTATLVLAPFTFSADASDSSARLATPLKLISLYATKAHRKHEFFLLDKPSKELKW